METLASYVGGAWVPCAGPTATLVNPATEEPLAEAGSGAIDFSAALAFARDTGGPRLRQMTFAERGAILAAMAKVIHDHRDPLIALAIANGGNTRKDAKFDIDGAAATLAAYADLGRSLGDCRILPDGDEIKLGRTSRLSGRHVRVPRRGVAVHVNAFNFPAWGLCEKAAVALLAGMPVVSKPATATALVAHRMMTRFVAAEVLPAGALSLVCGGPGDLLEHLGGQDVLAFTGSSTTAETLRSLACVTARSVHINVEADSLNAAVLGPDVLPGTETWNLFVTDVVRDMTQKAGQKCTAIRRVVIPEAVADEVAAALAERLAQVTVGDPAKDGVGMGPLSSAAQHRDVKEGIARLCADTTTVFGDATVPEAGYFVSPVLARAADPRAPVVHDREVFGPVATLCPYSGDAAEAAAIVALGQGGLVVSVYSDQRDFIAAVLPELCPQTGRIYLGSAKMAAQSPGPGTVLPQLIHGGPGRAGGGEELGGAFGLALYQQRTALQGDPSLFSIFL